MVKFNFYGTLTLEAHLGIKDGNWDIRFAGGVLAEAVVTAHQPLTDPVRVLYQGRELAVLRAAGTYRLS